MTAWNAMPSILKKDRNTKAVLQIGFFSSIAVALFSFIAFGIGIFTPVESGPNCTGSCIGYPYTGLATWVPGDYLWIYPAIAVPIMLIVLLAAVHRSGLEQSGIFGLLGLCFAGICAAILIADYFIQLSVVEPSLLLGETADLSLLSMYNPHGFFIALEDLGYLMMSVAFLSVGASFAGTGRLGSAIRWLFLIAGVGAIVSFMALCMIYGVNLGYRFEVAVLSINWVTLIVGGILLGFHFRRLAR